jgi:chemotaxis protein histidine kinase CheA
MTASPPLNGHARPPMPVLGDWRPATPEPVEEQRTPEPQPEPAETSELVAQAQAEAIRAQAWADAEAQRIAAEAAAKAELIKAEEEARKQRIANDRAEKRFEEEQAAREARIAESNRKRAEADQAAAAVAEQAEIDKQAEAQKAQVVEKADKKWRKWAIGFYALCAAVALPVQCSAFWNRDKPWMVGAPVLLEIAALVVAFGTAAAVANKRPHWHFRLITWVLAFIAATVNLWHGLEEFDAATAIATALASVFGPGVWDLHEHGRIRKRDGVLTRRERKAQEKATKDEVKRKAAEEAQRAAEKKAADEAAEEERQKLSEERQREFPKVWAEAVKIGAALGKAPDDPAVWPRAYRNIEGTEPGESIESITARRAAEKRVEAALSGTPVSTLSKTTNAQRAAQMPPGPNRVLKARATRRPGDTQKYSTAARKQASIAARDARQKDQ